MQSTGHKLFALLTMVLAINCAGQETGGGTIQFYVGSSGESITNAVFLCELDRESDEISVIDSFAGAESPSYLAFSADRRTVYCNDDTESEVKPGTHTVTSFRVEEGNSGLVHLNSQSSEGTGPCHVSCDLDAPYLFVANYNSGHAAVFPLAGNGEIQPASSVVTGSGSGPVEERQKGPHAHQVVLDPQHKFLLVPDLGCDRIWIYAFDAESGLLKPNPEQSCLELPPGTGPRHLVFHPSGKFVYIAGELNATVTACRYHEENGTLTYLSGLSTVSDSHVGSKYPAAIRIHPGGNYLYVSTRGENSCLTVFKVDAGGGLERIQVLDKVPAWPREFNLDPSGKILLIAGERSDEIALYHINEETGKLSGGTSRVTLPAPASILFIE